MKAKTSVLIADGERTSATLIAGLLRQNGYTVLRANGGNEAVTIAATQVTNLILLDLNLPDIGGMAVLQNIREWSEVPIIIVSARQDETDKVKALDAGADDYITKPFGNEELLARIRTALRHAARIKNNLDMPTGFFSTGGLTIDYVHRLVSVDGGTVHLTPIEYRILSLLARNSGKVLTHDTIICEIWGPYSADRQVLWVNIANIRRKIEPEPSKPCYLLTETGIGYRMIAADSPDKINDRNEKYN